MLLEQAWNCSFVEIPTWRKTSKQCLSLYHSEELSPTAANVGSRLSHLERSRAVSSPLHADVKGGPLHLQFRAPQPGIALFTASAMRAIGSSDAGLPQQEAESSRIQEARAVELHPPGRTVDGKSPGLKGGVCVGVDQRQARAMHDAASIIRWAEVHKHACAAQGNMEGGPDTEPCESCREENTHKTFNRRVGSCLDKIRTLK